MNKKLLSLLVALVAMFGCLGSMQAQNWTWTGETPSSGNAYALCAELNGVKKFLNDNNGFDDVPTVIWNMTGDFPGDSNEKNNTGYSLTSDNNKQIAIYATRGGFLNLTTYRHFTSSGEGYTGNDVILVSSGSEGGPYNILRTNKSGNNYNGDRNVVVENWSISIGANATNCWYFYSKIQVDLRNDYISTYKDAQELSETFEEGTVPDVLSQALTTCASANKDNAGTQIKILEDAMKEAAQKFNVKVVVTTNNSSVELSRSQTA